MDGPSSSRNDGALPIFDIGPYLSGGDEGTREALCRGVAESLKRSGALVVTDPRVDSRANSRFIDVMEAYFGQSSDVKMRDARPHLHYQVGVTPEGIERPRCLNDQSIQGLIDLLGRDEASAPRRPHGPDPKWRYFWRLGDRPTQTRFQELNAEPVVPTGPQFADWVSTMDAWGHLMLGTIKTVSEMVALGLGLDKEVFTQRMQYGPHLLAPTGTDLLKHGEVGTVFAGFHNDLNFLTVHGKSRFPGLFIWLRDGKKVPVRIPDGCLLLQAGKQMEWLTGGTIRAGYHEVVGTEETARARDEALKAGRSTWRVSSTVFSQLASDEVLRVLDKFLAGASDEERQAILERYPAMPVGQFVEEELRCINLRG